MHGMVLLSTNSANKYSPFGYPSNSLHQPQQHDHINTRNILAASWLNTIKVLEFIQFSCVFFHDIQNPMPFRPTVNAKVLV